MKEVTELALMIIDKAKIPWCLLNSPVEAATKSMHDQIVYRAIIQPIDSAFGKVSASLESVQSTTNYVKKPMTIN